MIYDRKGNELYRTFDYVDTDLESAYDNHGNLIFTKLWDLVVMSYNVQWWTLRNANEDMQREIIGKYNPDIIGMQEFSKTSAIPAKATTILSAYPYKYNSNHYNFNAIASKTELGNVTDTDFSYVDDEHWSYQKAYLTVKGKRIAFFNTHFTWRGGDVDKAGRASQAQELLAAMNEEEYVIATGDYNCGGLTFDSDDYIGTFKPFPDAGYKMVNFTQEAGITKTYTGKVAPADLSEFNTAPDNIIISPNISIYRTVFDTTKLKYNDGNYIDHIPIITWLKIN